MTEYTLMYIKNGETAKFPNDMEVVDKQWTTMNGELGVMLMLQTAKPEKPETVDPVSP